ncbi:MAG: DUF6491 family protein [Henriciella sp.]
MTKHQIVFAAMTFILAACATARDGSEEPKKMSWETDERLGERVDKICFGSNIDGFKQTTRTSVVVSEGRNDYLIETYRGCFDLSSAGSLSLENRGACLRKGDRIRPFQSAFGPSTQDFHTDTCLIKAIYEWDQTTTEAPPNSDALDE